MEYEVRPATLADLPAVLELLNTAELAESGSADWTPELLQEEWTQPAAELSRDGFVAWAGGLPIAYGGVLDRPETGRLQGDHYVRPGERHWPAGRAVLDHMVARTAEKAEQSGRAEVVLTMGQMVDAPFANRILPATGWRIARQFARMARDLTSADAGVVPLPAGVAARTVTDETDRRSFHRVATESFSQHWGSHPEPYDTFMKRVETREANDWSLWWLAAADGVDVGCLRSRPWAEGAAFIDTLGVLKAARGRGIGSALLKVSFAEFAARGSRRVELMVDTGNVTSALRVYESVGMLLTWQADIWERIVAAV